MGFAEARQRNAARVQKLKSRQTGVFTKWVQDKDQKLVIIVEPFEGFDRPVKQKDGTFVKNRDGTLKTKPHYRMHVLGECNLKSGIGVGVSMLTIEDVRRMMQHPEEAKITTAPQSMTYGIGDLIDQGYSILCITRNGAPNSTETTYTVMEVDRLKSNELQALAPKISKEDLLKLQTEEQWNDISDEERQVLENLGGGAQDE